MIGWEYPPHNSGGLGVACQGIIEHLVDAGREVLLVIPGEVPKATQTIEKTPKGGKYKKIILPSRLKAYPLSGQTNYSGNLIKDVYSFADNVLEAVKNEEFRVIHIHDWLTAPAGIALKNRYKKPLIMHVHSTEYDRTAGGEPNDEIAAIERSGFENADILVAVSGYTKKILCEKYGVSPAKISVVHNGVELPPDGDVDTDFLGDSPLVLFAGRITVQKGADNFIRMARKILRVRPETIFVVAGSGDMYQNIVEYSALEELSGSILFSGFIRGTATMAKLYRRASVLVMPSVSEPFGLVALEAASYGLPVIVSRTSGVSEVLPSAIVVDFWDSDLMAREVIDLISKKQKKEKIGSQLKTETHLLTWDDSVKKLQGIYKKLLK